MSNKRGELLKHFSTFYLCLAVAFRIYDMDKDGFISNGELFQVLKMMVGSNLKDTQLQQIVDKTIINADKDGDGRISFEEFCAVSGITYSKTFINDRNTVRHEYMMKPVNNVLKQKVDDAVGRRRKMRQRHPLRAELAVLIILSCLVVSLTFLLLP